jgi:hypothetical protein
MFSAQDMKMLPSAMGQQIMDLDDIIENNVLDNNSYDHIDWKLTMMMFSLLNEIEPS